MMMAQDKVTRETNQMAMKSNNRAPWIILIVFLQIFHQQIPSLSHHPFAENGVRSLRLARPSLALMPRGVLHGQVAASQLDSQILSRAIMR